jgi:hypothetical protein
LDLLVASTNFEADRTHFLESLCMVLRRPDSTEATPSSGWKLLPIGLGHYVRLTHPQLDVRLDVQVSTVDSWPSAPCVSDRQATACKGKAGMYQQVVLNLHLGWYHAC